MSYQEKNFLGDLGSSSYLNYGQEVLDVLNISQLLSSNSLNSNKLESYLTQTIAQCQKHYIGQPELATESDSKVLFLCLILEQILSHGLRNKISFSSNSKNIQKLLEYIREFNISSKSKLEFWNCVSFILPNQERERFLSLKLICTDTGRGRAWLRSTLNERSLERYLKCLLDEPEVLEQFYESKAWIRDKDKYRVLLKAAADISPIVFALGIDSPDLNTSSPEQTHLLLRHCTEPEIIPSNSTTILSPTQSNSPRGTPPNNGSVSPSKFRRSKKPSQSIISFDDTGENKGAVTKIVPQAIESALKMAGKRDVFETDQLNYDADLERKNLADLAENGPLSELRKNVETTSSSSVQNSFPFSKENSASLATSSVSKSHNTHANSVTQSATSHVNSSAQNCDSQFNNSQSNSGLRSLRDSTDLSSSNYQSAPSISQINSHVAPSNNSQPHSHLNLVASNTYLTPSNNPTNTYFTPSNSTNTYLTSSNPSNTYLTPSNNSSNTYLAPSNLEFSNPSSLRSSQLTPSNNSSSAYLAPSNLEFSNPSSRSSQDSLLEADGLCSEVDLMSVSQYSEARSDLSMDHRSVTGGSTVSTMDDGGSSVYSNAHSTQGRGGGEFSSLRIMGDTGIGELTPLTSYIATSSYISSQPGLDNALDASLYTDDYSGCAQGIDAAKLYGDGTGCSQSHEFEGEEDSLSICSTSDGGVSTSVPLHESRRSGGGGGGSQMGREAMDEKRDARYEAQIQELNRENELLKHQLRKYVTAVQLLNTDQQQHIVPSTNNSTSASSSSSEAESEARAYEKKLVQLAEMHSELLEMNQRLKIDLIARESTVSKLTSELMILRGVKPSPVSLWLPCVFLGGPPSDPHHIYQIHIRVGTEEWNVYRRYSDFYTFNKTIHRRYPKTIKQLSPQVKFPPKNLIFNKGNKSALFVEERRQKLELYLRAIVTTLVDYEFGTSATSTTTSGERKLNKYALVTLVPFLNEFYKSANVAR
uniref:Sorting nexin-29 n=1 Tax=Cacopsylla melanoneura TaxID=428564 RepID=A0A8D8W9F8_9HEMI